MKQKIVVNIGRLAGILPARKERLCGKEMAQMETLENAWMLIEDGRINVYTVESTVYWRSLNIKAPVAGRRPKPQGAG